MKNKIMAYLAVVIIITAGVVMKNELKVVHFLLLGSGLLFFGRIIFKSKKSEIE